MKTFLCFLRDLGAAVFGGLLIALLFVILIFGIVGLSQWVVNVIDDEPLCEDYETSAYDC